MRVKVWLIRGLLMVPIALGTLAVGGAAIAVSSLPDLQPWHHLVSDLEPRASEITPTFTLEAYLEREEAVFREMRDQVETVVTDGANPAIPNRYVTASRSHPDRLGSPWNRTSLLTVPAPRGGALMVHGLTDSPYSMRALAERMHAAGYYTLSLRMQGHGTVPGGLVNTTWEDWSAAVRMGARHVRQAIGPDLPLVLFGYSNGGALVTKYALDALDDTSLPPPAKLILLSPMIGVSPAARLARTISLLGPVVEKARWIDVVPEYNPFRYNSFPANAGAQTSRLTRAIASQLVQAGRDGVLDRMPPVLAFQSVVDTTVSTPAVALELLDRLPPGRNELVLFDLNRQAGIDAFTRPEAVLPLLVGDRPRPYTVTLVTNTDGGNAGGLGQVGRRRRDHADGRAAGTVLAGCHVFAVAHRAAVPGRRPDLWRRGHGSGIRKHFARPSQSARGERRPHHPRRRVGARVVEPVLPLSGEPRRSLDCHRCDALTPPRPQYSV